MSSSVASIAAEDLTRDHLVLGAPRDAQGRPSLGGIPLLKKLGQGGMGAVYYAFHPRLEVEVAIKVLTFHLVAGDSSAVKRFVSEARLAARLRSPHLVGVLDIDEENGIHYIVMEFVPGISAGSCLRSRLDEGAGGLTELEAVILVRAASRGLAEAHKNQIIHRDVKPDNILLPKRPGADLLDLAGAKLADLGLAKAEGQSSGATGTNYALGTPGYMAPEQIRDVKRAGASADVFGMGAALYALLSGCAPFEGSSPQESLIKTLEGARPPLAELRGGLSERTIQLVERCLEIKPENRPPDAIALLVSLDELEASLRRASAAETLPVNVPIPKRTATEARNAAPTEPPVTPPIPRATIPGVPAGSAPAGAAMEPPPSPGPGSGGVTVVAASGGRAPTSPPAGGSGPTVVGPAAGGAGPGPAGPGDAPPTLVNDPGERATVPGFSYQPRDGTPTLLMTPEGAGRVSNAVAFAALAVCALLLGEIRYGWLGLGARSPVPEPPTPPATVVLATPAPSPPPSPPDRVALATPAPPTLLASVPPSPPPVAVDVPPSPSPSEEAVPVASPTGVTARVVPDPTPTATLVEPASPEPPPTEGVSALPPTPDGSPEPPPPPPTVAAVVPPPPPPPPAPMGMIRFASRPPQARILDAEGRDTGQRTDGMIQGLAAGEQRFTLVLDGYYPKEVRWVVEPGIVGTIDETLVPIVVPVELVGTPDGARGRLLRKGDPQNQAREVVLGGPQVFVPPGEYLLEVQAPGYVRRDLELTLDAGRSAPITVDLAPLLLDLTLVSDPLGARAWWDGVELPARTPAQVQKVSLGEHDLRLEHEAGAVKLGWSGKVAVAEGMGGIVNQKLVRISARLTFASTPPGAKVTCKSCPDGRVLGSAGSGLALDIGPGRHEFVFEAPGHRAATVAVEVAAGVDQEVKASLVRSGATLAVKTDVPAVECEVLVDGDKVPPKERGAIPVAPGAHRIEVHRAGYVAEVQSVSLADGKTETVNLTPKRGIKAFLDGIAASQQFPKAGTTLVSAGWIRLVWIPPGSYTRGTPGGDPSEQPVHKVTLATGFFAGAHEIDKFQWARVEARSDDVPYEDVPATNMGFREAERFAGKMTAWEQETGQLSRQWSYRLPSEAEWEYLARAGTTRPTHFEGALKDWAFCAESPALLHPVGIKKPSPWGLFDLYGNAEEWVRDDYLDSYEGYRDDGTPRYRTESEEQVVAEEKVVRGGSSASPANECRSAFRGHAPPSEGHPRRGFRVLLVPNF